MKFTRRDALVLTAAASAATITGVSPVLAAEGDVHSMDELMQPEGITDIFLGPDDAKVTVIEYASPTCPHCAAFHVNVLPEFTEKYIDTGKVRFTVRPFIRNVLDAVVFMLADAAGEDGYYPLLDAYFENQNAWALSDKPKDAIMQIALQHGFTEESFEAALTNQELFEGLEKAREQALNEFDLSGTPTFYINGKQLSGDKTIEEMAAEIDPLLG